MLRYWDGGQWTSYTQPAGAASSPDPSPVRPVQPMRPVESEESERIPIFGARKLAEELQLESMSCLVSSDIGYITVCPGLPVAAD